MNHLFDAVTLGLLHCFAIDQSTHHRGAFSGVIPKGSVVKKKPAGLPDGSLRLHHYAGDLLHR
jgi:hypothetical protein